MQAVQAVRSDIKSNDTRTLPQDLVIPFRAWLEARGVAVSDSGGGQYFRVRLEGQQRWLAIERGKGGAPVTPVALRNLIGDFLQDPSALVLRTVAPAPAVSDENPNFQILPLGAVPAPAAANKPRVRCKGAGCAKAVPPAPTEDAQYLSDLRDDFALHAPFSFDGLIHVNEETLESLVQLRWQYADLMMKHRPPVYGD